MQIYSVIPSRRGASLFHSFRIAHRNTHLLVYALPTSWFDEMSDSSARSKTSYFRSLLILAARNIYRRSVYYTIVVQIKTPRLGYSYPPTPRNNELRKVASYVYKRNRKKTLYLTEKKIRTHGYMTYR